MSHLCTLRCVRNRRSAWRQTKEASPFSYVIHRTIWDLLDISMDRAALNFESGRQFLRHSCSRSRFFFLVAFRVSIIFVVGKENINKWNIKVEKWTGRLRLRALAMKRNWLCFFPLVSQFLSLSYFSDFKAVLVVIFLLVYLVFTYRVRFTFPFWCNETIIDPTSETSSTRKLCLSLHDRRLVRKL